MALHLHRTKVADWDKPGIAKRNPWQKMAKKSKGTITPGNFVSILGAIVAVYGLYEISNGSLLLGFVALGIGRLMDVADGMIADYTGTKSPLGETVDAVLDKSVMLAALILLFVDNLAPAVWLVAIGLQNILNIAFSLIAKVRHISLHPSGAGKLSVFAVWPALIGYPLGNLARAENIQLLGWLLIVISYVCFAIFVVLGGKATIDYGREAIGPRKREKYVRKND